MQGLWTKSTKGGDCKADNVTKRLSLDALVLADLCLLRDEDHLALILRLHEGVGLGEGVGDGVINPITTTIDEHTRIRLEAW